MSAFVLTDNQTMLPTARASTWSAATTPPCARRTWRSYATAPERWREFAELGWFALALPEADGGLGGSIGWTWRAGRGTGLRPGWWSLAGQRGAGRRCLLARAGTAMQRAAAESLAAGDKRLALTVWERGARLRCDAGRHHGGCAMARVGTSTARRTFVLGAGGAMA